MKNYEKFSTETNSIQSIISKIDGKIINIKFINDKTIIFRNNVFHQKKRNKIHVKG